MAATGVALEGEVHRAGKGRATAFKKILVVEG